MVNSKKESVESANVRRLVEAYELVYADIEQDIGWRGRIKKRVLDSLGYRMWELENVWDDILEFEQNMK